jgi:hypothetical protein
MGTFPRSPRIQKGAFLRYDRASPNGKLIVFPYNPEALVRRISPAPANNPGGDAGETIDLTLELNAADELQNAQPGDPAVRYGLHPILSALKTLLEGDDLQPSIFSRLIPPNQSAECLTLFLWGSNRTLPVKMLSMQITENAFDVALNPIQARVELSMQVLSAVNLRSGSLGYRAYLNHKQRMQELARLVEQEPRSDPFLPPGGKPD